MAYEKKSCLFMDIADVSLQWLVLSVDYSSTSWNKYLLKKRCNTHANISTSDSSDPNDTHQRNGGDDQAAQTPAGAGGA